MRTTVVRIAGAEITDAAGFHDAMARALGFPDFYGANLDALADCLLSVDEPDHFMVHPAIGQGEMLLLQIDDAHLLKRHCPREYEALIAIVAVENQRRVAAGGAPVLGLALVGDLEI